MLRAAVRAITLSLAILGGCQLFLDVGDDGATRGPADAGDAESFDGRAASDSDVVDAGPASPPPPCYVDRPFTNLRPVPGVGASSNEFRPTLSADELVIVFAQVGYALNEAHRSDRSKPFGTVVGIETYPGSASLAPDGLTLYYSQPPTTGAETDIFRATRSTITSGWGDGGALAAPLNTNAAEGDPFVWRDSLFFASRRTADEDLYVAKLDHEAGVIDVRAIEGVGINISPGEESSPVLTDDGLRLFFASDRPFGEGGADIWTAARPSIGDPFGAVENVRELNTSGSEYPGWVSPDGCRFYFTSERPGGPGDFDVWLADRPPRL